MVHLMMGMMVGLMVILDGEHYFAIKGALDGALDGDFDGKH